MRFFPSHSTPFLFFINSPLSSLYLGDKRKRDFVTSGYKADDEASDDGELPCNKGMKVLFPFKYLYCFSIFSLFQGAQLFGVQRKKRRAKEIGTQALLPYFFARCFLRWPQLTERLEDDFFSINSVFLSLYLEDMKKRVNEGSDYEADDEGSDDGEMPCGKGMGARCA